MARLVHIDAISLAKFSGLYGLIMGLIFGIIFTIIGLFGGAAMFGVFGIIFFPLAYGIGGFVAGLIIGIIFNLILGWIGGIGLDFEQ